MGQTKSTLFLSDKDIASELRMSVSWVRKQRWLPIHDSFIVRRWRKDALHVAMEEAFEETLGVKGKIDRNEAVYDDKGCRLMHLEARYFGIRELFVERAGYHRRDFEWKVKWGLKRTI